ncbi:hypothetical protein HPP92_012812 [Vanilla planifolia]|uniref:UFSP1/2/DUB catalytic domain-containing protein n=1 Tax=Vanilla planifolia TaxID=51239 RepID=A0A835QM92_VANPL|nr:hypothetical protein HPP92_012812 [Vanilla planifolia]
MLSICPFCQRNVPSADLEWHANNHFSEDDIEMDMQLAKQISLEQTLMDVPVYLGESSNDFWGSHAQISMPNFSRNLFGSAQVLLEERLSRLLALQTKGNFYKVNGGLMSLLGTCLELESRRFKSVISGYIDHYQSIKSEDSSWGCGWRNIQMLCSHLLVQREEAREVLFGAAGFVPDIPSLQRWLEIAWERGFDLPGSHHFNNQVFGSRKWIGTTECAAVLRSFGLRARIIDFDSLSTSSPSTSNTRWNHRQFANHSSHYRDKLREKPVYGPMDKFLQRCNGDKDRNYDYFNPSKNEGEASDHVLLEWVWDYFTSDVGCKLDDVPDFFTSQRSPLYFQQDGHSRTIVGIQMQKHLEGSQQRYNLLILDPEHRTKDLENSLRHNNGWQKLLKRGAHTLKKQQYQLCYIDPGIACGKELEDLKTINSQVVGRLSF